MSRIDLPPAHVPYHGDAGPRHLCRPDTATRVECPDALPDTVPLPLLRKGVRCRLTLDVTLKDDPRQDGRVWVETDEGTNMIVDRWALEAVEVDAADDYAELGNPVG